MIILHSQHSAASIAFIARFADGNTVIDWYDNPIGQLQYLLSGLPQPSGFPFVVHNNRGFVNPESPQWVIDEVAGRHLTEREKLDSMRSLSKMKILDALDLLPDERAKYDVLMQNKKFKERWGATLQLELDHPITQQALAQVDMDVNAIKRKIINM